MYERAARRIPEGNRFNLWRDYGVVVFEDSFLLESVVVMRQQLATSDELTQYLRSVGKFLAEKQGRVRHAQTCLSSPEMRE